MRVAVVLTLKSVVFLLGRPLQNFSVMHLQPQISTIELDENAHTLLGSKNARKCGERAQEHNMRCNDDDASASQRVALASGGK
jgi:hypothetical protein